MNARKIWDIPAGFADRFPDGDYTIGRGADPRGRPIATEDSVSATQRASVKGQKPKRNKKPVRPAAE